MCKITITKTRFKNLGIRSYRNVYRVGVPGYRKPFKDSWLRYVDLSDDADIGPSFKTMAEAMAGLTEYAIGFNGSEVVT
jgi:hypothetical protein